MTNKTHWIAQILAMVLQVLNLATNIVPQKYQPVVTFAIGIVQAGMGLYNHYYNPDGTPASVAYVAKLLLLFLLAGSATMAQTPAPKPIFTVGSQALAIHIGGQTVAGADEVAVFNVKGNFSLQSDNVQFSSACSTCAAVSGQLYVAGPKYNLSALAKKLDGTNLSGIAPYIHGAIGVARNAPGVGPTTQHIAGMVDLGFDYKVNNTFSFGPRGGLVIAPGVGPTCVTAPCPSQSPRGYFASIELLAVLGKK